MTLATQRNHKQQYSSTKNFTLISTIFTVLSMNSTLHESAYVLYIYHSHLFVNINVLGSMGCTLFITTKALSCLVSFIDILAHIVNNIIYMILFLHYELHVSRNDMCVRVFNVSLRTAIPVFSLLTHNVYS